MECDDGDRDELSDSTDTKSVKHRPDPEPLCSKQLLFFLKEDHVYTAMADHFLRQNRGRRPNLPHIPALTNGLLLQLEFIKEEKGDSSFRELKTWFEVLFPDSASVSESRIAHRIRTLKTQCERMSENDCKALMSNPFSFHTLSPPLAAIGLSRLHLTDQQPYSLDQDNQITNSIVIHLDQFRNNERLNPGFVRKWIKYLCPPCSNLTDSMVRTRVDRVIKTHKSLSNKKKFQELQCYLSQAFFDSSAEKTVQPQQKPCVECEHLNDVIQNCHHRIKLLQTEKQQIQLNSATDKKNEKIFNLKKDEQINDIKKDLHTSQKACDKLLNEMESMRTTKLYKKNFAYRQEINTLKEEKVERDVELKNEKEKLSALSKKLKEKNLKLKHEQTMKSKYKSSSQIATAKNRDLFKMLSFDEEIVKLREEGSSHRYSDGVRQTFYALQGEVGVAAANCSKVVETVAKHLFDTNLSKQELPCAATAVNFASEANIIAKHQAVDEIIKCDTFTYACDGTSRQKAHFLEQHIVLSNGKQLSLGFSEIACDDSQTLLEQCVALFKDLCEVYCLDDPGVDSSELLKDVIRKMTCLMSDRAAVMKAFNKKMSNYKEELLEGEDCTTYFLFCNAHFLLALSAAAEKALKVVEMEVGDGKLGRDSISKFSGFSASTESAAMRLIRLSAEVLGPRGDEKSGCRQEWLAFCSSRGIKSTFSSYRTNRFNNLFQNATALLRHMHHIQLFLDEFVSHSNLKLQSIVADLKDVRIINLISVLSFLHVSVTESYWKLMNSTKSYADFTYYVQKMQCLFDLLCSDDFVLNSEFVPSVFDDEFTASISDLAVMKDFLNSSLFTLSYFNPCLKAIVQECSNALARQLSEFLSGGSFDASLADDVRNILKTCPLTNLTGERLFGDLDYCINKRRNASLILRSTTNMWKHNKTTQWLSRQTPRATQALIERAVKYGPEWKRRNLKDKQAVNEKVQARIEENKIKKDEKAVKVAERKTAAIDAILAEGGCIVSSKEELDILYSGPRSFERMKDQIRFRSLVRGESITVTGTKKNIYDRLLLHITCNKE